MGVGHKKLVLLLPFLLLFSSFGEVSGQKMWIIGPQAGYNYTTVAFSSFTPTQAAGSLHYGLLATYLPGDRKPGLKFSFNQTELAFSETINDTNITYGQRGQEFQLLSHLFLRSERTKFFIDMGPGIAHMAAVREIDQTGSIFPEFKIENLNKVHVLLTGGAGFTQRIGKMYLSIFGQFSFDTVKVFPTLQGLSNPLIVRGGGSLQWKIGN